MTNESSADHTDLLSIEPLARKPASRLIYFLLVKDQWSRSACTKKSMNGFLCRDPNLIRVEAGSRWLLRLLIRILRDVWEHTQSHSLAAATALWRCSHRSKCCMGLFSWGYSSAKKMCLFNLYTVSCVSPVGSQASLLPQTSSVVSQERRRRTLSRRWSSWGSTASPASSSTSSTRDLELQRPRWSRFQLTWWDLLWIKSTNWESNLHISSKKI